MLILFLVFGSSFTVYVPAIMTLVALITLFDGFTRILLLFGIESEHSPAPCKCSRKGIPSPEEDEKLRAGQSLIMNELKKNAFKSNEDHSTHSENISPMINQTPIIINNLTITNRHPSSYSTIHSSRDIHDDDDLDDDDEIVDIELNSLEQNNKKYSNKTKSNNQGNNWTNSFYGIITSDKNKDSLDNNSDSNYNPLRGNRNEQPKDIFSIPNDDSDNLYGGRYSD